MKEKRNYRIIVIIALILSMFCISIGYSSYNTLLEINAIGSISQYKWFVGFNNISDPIIENNARETSSPIISASNIILDFALPTPGDSITYTFDVVNSGNIDAKLELEPIFNVPNELKDSLLYILTYIDGTPLKPNDDLNADETKKLKLKISYQPNDGVVHSNTLVNASTTLLYVQK